MTKAEIETIQNIIARLREPNLGCAHGFGDEQRIETLRQSSGSRLEVASRLYVDTWIIPSLEMLLPGKSHDPGLARRMSRR